MRSWLAATHSTCTGGDACTKALGGDNMRSSKLAQMLYKLPDMLGSKHIIFHLNPATRSETDARATPSPTSSAESLSPRSTSPGS